ncbi:MAG: hypothetical protein WKG32_09000 [Gemmatimonadaceae bacterium]
MKKAIELKVSLRVEGEGEPAHDFARAAMAAVRAVFKAGSDARPEVRIRISRIVEHRDDGDDESDADEGDESGGADEDARAETGEPRDDARAGPGAAPRQQEA